MLDLCQSRLSCVKMFGTPRVTVGQSLVPTSSTRRSLVPAHINKQSTNRGLTEPDASFGGINRRVPNYTTSRQLRPDITESRYHDTIPGMGEYTTPPLKALPVLELSTLTVMNPMVNQSSVFDPARNPEPET